MLALRQKDHRAKQQENQESMIRLLEDTNTKLDVLIELLRTKDFSVSSSDFEDRRATMKKAMETDSFIPSINLIGMSDNTKNVDVKKRNRDLSDNLKKLKDIEGKIDG